MAIEDFYLKIKNDVQAIIDSPSDDDDDGTNLHPELVFAEIVMDHMSSIGMTFEPKICYFDKVVSNAKLRLSGYSLSDDADQLDLFVCHYNEQDILSDISGEDLKRGINQGLQFFKKCVSGVLIKSLNETDDAYDLVLTIQECYQTIVQIRIFIITNMRNRGAKQYQPQEVEGKTIQVEIMDIERFNRHMNEGKPREELVVDFRRSDGIGIPCIYIPGDMGDYDAGYDYILTAIPGEVLRKIYENYGARLLEANVRSFLSVSGKTNKGIQDTLRNEPERFMAYNNGIVVIADEFQLGSESTLEVLKGMQIVNGGQTTASIYFGKKKYTDIDLNHVRVPAKIIVLRKTDKTTEEKIVSDISKYANTQNKVNLSDLSANNPFHVAIENLSLQVYCPDGKGRWFYERTAGSYNVMLAREGSTPAKLRKIRLENPTSRKISKTELARYLNTWGKKPDLVSRGLQKNFEVFMLELNNHDLNISSSDYKKMIAKVILFKKAQSIIRSAFKAFQGNITIYTIAFISNNFGEQFDLDYVWQRQDISDQLKDQIKIWATNVHDLLHTSSDGKMISEWAKREQCWQFMKQANYSKINNEIPELKNLNLS